MTDRTSQPFISGLSFGECPRWHEGRLWYSDFYVGTVSSAGVGSGAPDRSGGEADDVRVEHTVPGGPAGLGWLPDGDLLVVSRKPRTVLRVEADGTLVDHGDLNPLATFHANDMVVDAKGRAYVGNFGFDLDGFLAEKGGMALFRPPGPPTASLIRVDPDGSAHLAADDLAFPNGAVIAPDGGTLIIAETLGQRLTAFSIDPDGGLSNRRVWADLPRCSPDGICLDADGQVWVANAIAAECLRVAEGGEITDRVTTTQTCFACMLGGPDRRTLFLVTAPTSTESIVSTQRAGRIERADVTVAGAGLP
jgi:sugar lactone lactonase YvrE